MSRIVPILSPEQAVSLIKDQDTVSFCGAGGGIVEPYLLIAALAQRFRREQSPRDLTFIHATGLGDRQDRGMSPLAQKGLVSRIIGGHWDQSPRLAEMAARNELEAWNIPMGMGSRLYRAAAAHQPGLLSRIGLHTYIDPRLGGGRLNSRTKRDLVSLCQIDGRDYLFYRALAPDVALIRASTADAEGYLSMEDEIAYVDVLDQALAAHNNGGKVIAQVGAVTPAGSLHPKNVRVPGYLVDALVPAPHQEQLYDAPVSSYFSGDSKSDGSRAERLPLTERKVIARRALLEARAGQVANVGVGICDGIGLVALEEGVSGQVTFTMETGPIGGVSARGMYFGASYNNKAIIPMPSQFDFYEGGGLDIAFLSLAQLDPAGNVNVSRFNGRIVGTGGFIEISQTSRKAVFCGTMTSGGLETRVGGGRLEILREGRFRKALPQVEEITYSGAFAREEGREAVYITERAVFRLTERGLTLTEYAPGLDLERDILSQMEFRPHISPQLRPMDPRLFREEKMGISL